MKKITSTFALGLALTLGAAGFAPAAHAAPALVSSETVSSTPRESHVIFAELRKADADFQAYKAASQARSDAARAAMPEAQRKLDAAVAAEKAAHAATVRAAAPAGEKLTAVYTAKRAGLEKKVAAERASLAAKGAALKAAVKKEKATFAKTKSAYDTAYRSATGAKRIQLKEAHAKASAASQGRIAKLNAGYAKEAAASKARTDALAGALAVAASEYRTDTSLRAGTAEIAKKASDDRIARLEKIGAGEIAGLYQVILDESSERWEAADAHSIRAKALMAEYNASRK